MSEEKRIKTELLKLDLLRGIAVVKALVMNEKEEILATGHKLEYQKNCFNFLEEAENKAIERALSCLSIGNREIPEENENSEKEIESISDLPRGFDRVKEEKKATTKQKTFIYNLMNNLEINKEQMLQIFFDCSGREVESINDLTISEASKVIQTLQIEQRKRNIHSGEDEEPLFLTDDEEDFDF